MNKLGDMEEIVNYITWIAFTVILLGGLYFLARRVING